MMGLDVRVLCLALAMMVGGACGGTDSSTPTTIEGSSEPAKGVQSKPPEFIDVSRSDLIFRYWDDSAGGYESGSFWEKIPNTVPRLIIVRDPKVRHPGVFLVVDRENCVSARPCTVVAMSGRDFKKAMAKQRGGPGPGDDDERSYTRTSLQFFSAQWCGVCNQARSFLKKERIPFVEHDVEKKPQARKILQSLGKKNGLRPEQLSSVPIFVYGTKIMVGFSPEKLKRFVR